MGFADINYIIKGPALRNSTGDARNYISLRGEPGWAAGHLGLWDPKSFEDTCHLSGALTTFLSAPRVHSIVSVLLALG